MNPQRQAGKMDFDPVSPWKRTAQQGPLAIDAVVEVLGVAALGSLRLLRSLRFWSSSRYEVR